MAPAKKLRKTVTSADQQPQPRGTPSKSLFYSGAIGAALTAIGVLVWAMFMVMAFTRTYIGDPAFWRGLMIISTMFIGLGCILTGVGFYGFYRNYGQVLGIASLALAIIAALLWIILLVIIFNLLSFGQGNMYEFIGILLLAIIFSGIMLVVQGVNVNSARHFAGAPALLSSQSVIMITAGAFCSSIFLVLLLGIGLWMWAAAYFALIAVFLKCRLPSSD